VRVGADGVSAMAAYAADGVSVMAAYAAITLTPSAPTHTVEQVLEF